MVDTNDDQHFKNEWIPDWIFGKLDEHRNERISTWQRCYPIATWSTNHLNLWHWIHLNPFRVRYYLIFWYILLVFGQPPALLVCSFYDNKVLVGFDMSDRPITGTARWFLAMAFRNWFSDSPTCPLKASQELVQRPIASKRRHGESFRGKGQLANLADCVCYLFGGCHKHPIGSVCRVDWC